MQGHAQKNSLDSVKDTCAARGLDQLTYGGGYGVTAEATLLRIFNHLPRTELWGELWGVLCCSNCSQRHAAATMRNVTASGVTWFWRNLYPPSQINWGLWWNLWNITETNQEILIIGTFSAFIIYYIVTFGFIQVTLTWTQKEQQWIWGFIVIHGWNLDKKLAQKINVWQ